MDSVIERWNEALGFDLRDCSPQQAEDAEILIDRALCSKHFYHFMRKAWPIAFGSPLIDGLHISALAYHLQYLWESDEYETMLYATPPGCGKSSVACVMFSAWVWTKDPSTGQWFASFSQSLCDRDSLATRRLVTSDWFQKRFGDKFVLLDDQNQKRRFDNDKGGWRLAASIGSRIGFGEHPKLILIDDPLDPTQAGSETERKFAHEFLTDRISTRGIVKGVKKVLGGQRLHEDDCHAYLREIEGEDLLDLWIPMEFDPDRKCRTEITYDDIDDVQEDGSFARKDCWEDPRTERGELMWPQCMTEKKVNKLKKGLRHAHAISAQLQQEPTSPEGDLFKEEWFTIVDAAPSSGLAMRIWDKASSTGTKSDYTAGALVVDDGLDFYIVDMKRGKWERKQRDQIISDVAKSDAERWYNCEIRFEQEGGSGGKDAANIAAEQFARLGYRVRVDKPIGKPRDGHAGGWETFCEMLASGRVKIVKGRWNQAFIEECLAAPNGKHDDQIDAVARGVLKGTLRRKQGRINRPLLLVTKEEERQLQEAESKKSLCNACGGKGNCVVCSDDTSSRFDEFWELTSPREEHPLGVTF